MDSKIWEVYTVNLKLQDRGDVTPEGEFSGKRDKSHSEEIETSWKVKCAQRCTKRIMISMNLFVHDRSQSIKTYIIIIIQQKVWNIFLRGLFYAEGGLANGVVHMFTVLLLRLQFYSFYSFRTDGWCSSAKCWLLELTGLKFTYFTVWLSKLYIIQTFGLL